MRHALVIALSALSLALASGCSSVMHGVTDRFSSNLGTAILDSEDPATVRDGLPAYLLLLDSLIVAQVPGKPGNAPLLLAAARLDGAYAGNFTGNDPVHAQRLSAKAFDYARRATCLQDALLCAAIDQDPQAFAQVVGSNRNAALMYALASSWAGYLQAHTDDWSAIAALPKIEALLDRAVALQPEIDQGQAYVYLGVLNCLRPESVGGRPDKGRAYFETAITASNGRNLYAKTLFAEFYARQVFDRALHDRLLGEVLAADPRAPGLTLVNTLAQDRARTLLESSEEYF